MNKTTGRLLRLGCISVSLVFLVGIGTVGMTWGPPWIDRLTGGARIVDAEGEISAGYELADRTAPDEMAARRASDTARLHSYGWIDQAAGQVHIPIDAAIMILADGGLPARTPDPLADEPSESDMPPEATPEPPAEAADESAPATVDLTGLTYTEHILPIFEQHCAECHGADDPEEGLELTRYRTTIVGSQHGPVIEPGNPEASYLVRQLVDGRMPKDREPLSAVEIETVIAWIRSGAPEN